MRAVITVVGKDRIGIIARITNILAENSINIVDISQTIMQDIFTMVMLVELEASKISFNEIDEMLSEAGHHLNLEIRIQNEDIFNAMHRI